MVTATPNDPAIVCAERIAALHFLHHVPVPPSPNPVTSIHRRPAGYTLPFEKERSLAGTLAFLAYPKHDIDHIPAVCVEEAKHLNVILAVNKLDRENGQQLLEELKKSFEGIFSLLARADAGTSSIEIDVFKAIISMCSKRILHRLRLQGRRTHYQSIEKALQTAYEYLKHAERGVFKEAGLSPVLDEFIKKASRVLRLVRSWTRYQMDLELENLVEGIYRLRKVGDLRALFENGHIPDQIMPPSLRASLLNMIHKVARYREAAKFLYRMAREFPLARRMRVVIAQLSKKAFRRVPDDEHTPALDTTVSLTEGLKNHEKDLTHICRLLNGDEEGKRCELDKEKANDQFAEQTRETLRRAKIHAEIQLLYYCEQNVPHSRLPRVICSSKDACWLCNEFILLYQKIHMPKSHGRLYPGWRLPTLHTNGFDDLAKRYNQRLQISFKDSLKTLFVRQERTNYPEPNESTLLTLYLSDSTVSSVSLPLSNGKGKGVVEMGQEVVLPTQEEPTRELEPAYDEGSKGTAVEVEEIEEVAQEDSPATPEQGLAHDLVLANDEKGEEATVKTEGMERTPNTPTPNDQGPLHIPVITSNEKSKETIAEVEEAKIPPETPPTNVEEISDVPESMTGTSSTGSYGSSKRKSMLEPGEVRQRITKIGKTTPIYKAGSLLDVQLEYANGPSLLAPDRHRKKLSYAVEHLKPEDVEKLRNRGVVPIAGAELPEYWIDGDTDKDGCVYIANGDAVMRLFMRPVTVDLP
ncbi:hypothetical protein K449DRAFT_422208 [Hypoxylon sp. EC38]|nr:hypothetical protein K449DRAFT_422208 [Hypoxylon sp. EC38]